MARKPTPRPDGWTGGSEDFSFLRTLDGHRGVNPFYTPGDPAADADWRRNAKHGFVEADLGGIDGDEEGDDRTVCS